LTDARNLKAEVVICGAGIAGVSVAYHLAIQRGVSDVILVDHNPPLSLTSDRSSEGYRNWWPGPGDAMVALMNRSIDLMEEQARQSGNVFHLNRRGYLYVTQDPQAVSQMVQTAEEISALGAGPLRVHESLHSTYSPASAEGFEDQPTGADLLLDPALILTLFPYLSKKTIAVLHARRAGWLSAQQLGMHLLGKARQHGVRIHPGRVTHLELQAGQVHAVCLEDGSRIQTTNFVNAAGPMLKEVGHMMGVDLPVFCELHLKTAMKDPLGVLDRSAPMVICYDSQALAWSAEEMEMLAEDPALRPLLGRLPWGAHTRPEGGGGSQMILALWDYHAQVTHPTWPVPIDEQYAHVALRGLVRMIPGMQTYVDKPPRPTVDGGYYTKTRENRPLISSLPVKGAFVIGALSGFGIMASCAAGELLAAHISGGTLPSYASAFSVERYKDTDYQKLLENWGESGQL
jgi:glycine/D-amino acid oxidase-like deaminating enzyme